jgi:GWxTD domain-containing protein
LSFYYEIYSNKDDSLHLTYAINNKDGEPLFVQDKIVKVAKGKNEFNETINNLQFTLGDYQFEVKILDKNNKMIKGSGKKFYSKIYGFPTSIRDLDLAVKQMQYIASPSDIDEIESAETYSEKLKRFLYYWKRLDPSPNTVENETLNEYYRRVEYANANFKGYFKGWRSDMGMVYITLGPPDQVLRRPYEINSRPYEVWDYYVLNRSFIFVDQTNFGDYRLQNPAYGDWFRYRP